MFDCVENSLPIIMKKLFKRASNKLKKKFSKVCFLVHFQDHFFCVPKIAPNIHFCDTCCFFLPQKVIMEGDGSPLSSLCMVRAAELFPKPEPEKEDESLKVPFAERT